MTRMVPNLNGETGEGFSRNIIRVHSRYSRAIRSLGRSHRNGSGYEANTLSKCRISSFSWDGLLTVWAISARNSAP